MKTFDFTVRPEEGGTRIDLFLAARFAAEKVELSRRKIRSIIDVGGVYQNGKRVRIASREVGRGDKVRVQYSDEGLKAAKRQDFALAESDILFDEYGVIAVNKPPGLPAQATLDQSVMHVVPVVAAYFKQKTGKQRNLILVHRLDKETSGVLLLADSAERATFLTGAFRARDVAKTYWAAVFGIPKEPEFSERAYLSEIDKKTGHVRQVKAGGKSAVTHFTSLAVNQDLGISLLECRPETGRSHQIRVHLEINGLPIIGDKRYGKAAQRPLPPNLMDLASAHHFLHAKKLSFRPAQGVGPVTIEAALPDRFRNFLEQADLAPEGR